MLHVFRYNHWVDSQYLWFLQMKRLSQETMVTQILPTRGLLLRTPDPFEELPPGTAPLWILKYGFCLGFVFFIFKMLYSSMPESGGIFWAKEYAKWINQPIQIRNKSGFMMNPAMEDFIWLQMRYQSLVQAMISHQTEPMDALREIYDQVLIKVRKKFSSLKDFLSLSSASQTIHFPQTYTEHYSPEHIKRIQFSLASILNPDVTDMPASAEHFVKLLSANMNVIPDSFFCIIHHLSQFGRFDNAVLFHFVESVMNVDQKLLTESPVRDALLKTIEAEIGIANHNFILNAYLYEHFIRPTSFVQADFSVGGVLLLNQASDLIIYNYDPEKSLDPTSPDFAIKRKNAQVAHWFTVHLNKDHFRAERFSVKTHYHKPYSILYFMIISMYGTINEKPTGHIICGWCQEDPTGKVPLSTYLFDPSVGLLKLGAEERVGNAIVTEIFNNLVHVYQIESLTLMVQIYRGFY